MFELRASCWVEDTCFWNNNDGDEVKMLKQCAPTATTTQHRSTATMADFIHTDLRGPDKVYDTIR